MVGAIVYKSRYGSTQQYAEWLSESLQMELFDVSELRANDLDRFTPVIFCSPVYYGKVLLAKYIKQNWNLFKDKKIYFLTVAGVDKNAKQDIIDMMNLNFKPNILSHLKWFYLEGRMEVEKLKLLEKFIVKRLAKIIEDESERKKFQKGYNQLQRKNLDIIIETIKEDA